MVVDKQGWAEVADPARASTLDRLLEIQAESSERLADGEEPGMLSKVEMLHFKSPEPPRLRAEAEAARTGRLSPAPSSRGAAGPAPLRS